MYYNYYIFNSLANNMIDLTKLRTLATVKKIDRFWVKFTVMQPSAVIHIRHDDFRANFLTGYIHISPSSV